MKRIFIIAFAILAVSSHLFAESSLVGTTFNTGNGEYYMCYIITNDEVDNRTVALYKLPPNERRQLSGDIIIPESVEYFDNIYKVTSIQREAIMQTLVTSVTIPSTVTTIEADAFWGCSQLVSVYIPSSVVSIDTNVGIFNICDKLQEIIVDPNNPKYCSEDGILFDKTKATIVRYPSGKTQSAYSIPNSVSQIANAAFYRSINLDTITIPNGVETIGRNAFKGCTKLLSIDLPNSILSVDEQAFMNCDSLTTINISDNLESIGFGAFRDCVNLTSITIPSKVSKIPMEFCAGCDKLSSVTITKGVKNIEGRAFSGCTSLLSVDLPISIDTIGRAAFASCVRLSAINLHDSISSIGDYAFSDSGLKSFDIPKGLTKIEMGTFSNCLNLDTIIIPENIISIGKDAFYACNIIIDMLSAIPPENEGAFSKGNNFTIYVPCGSLETYQEEWHTQRWLQYKPTHYSLKITNSIGKNELLSYPTEEQLSECDTIVTISASNDEYNYYHFARWSDGNTDNPRQIPFNDNIQLTAIYELDTFLIHDYIGDDGYTTGGGYYKYGEEITVTAHPNYGYDFYCWDIGTTEPTRSIIVEGEMDLHLLFVKHKFRVNIIFDDTKGWVNYYSEFLLDYLTEIQLEVTPYETYEFDHWSDGNTENPRTMIIDRDIELTAYFREVSDGIEDIKFEGNSPQKIVVDGQLLILRSDKTYTLQGQEVK